MIKLEKINKSFNNEIILKDISLEIDSSEIFGIVGLSGTGKSTLLKIMNGFLSPDTGLIYIDNILLSKDNKLDIVKKTATIFQEYNLLNNLNVIKNILLPLKVRGKINEDDILKARNLLEFINMSDFENSNIQTLSGGQKQRVAIARALITDPKIIFCDEPTSALDKENTNTILELLKNINNTFKTTIIIVSHDINIIKAITNKTAIITNGALEEIVTVKNKAINSLSYKEELLND
ncbi:ATP-binding cassette domain-containing protein [Haploplasma modicum]|uniref:ATP-binding cassette domain-containing protein n=1 Tax=Haploplasma modicum TaxID=2150 RepID=UPI00214BBC0F|nr:ATP-binding cassette domain-containing protein [Haploplasma modicum]MCR1809206.1 ATP-binding cassette domain-containing protein [Haploplasma modicum]